MQSIWTFAVIIILAGLVAAGGDRIGRLAAKRRVNVLGMRPRVAARWVAVLTGVVIALGSLLGLAALSQDAREMLFHFQDLQKQVSTLEAQVEGLSSTRARLEADYQSLASRLAKTRETLSDRESEVNSLTDRIAESSRRLAATSQRLRSAEQEYSESQSRLKKLRAELAAQEAENEKLSAERKRLEGDIAALNDYKRTLESTARMLEQKTQELRQQNIRVAVNQPLAYVKVSGTSTLPEARHAILSGLEEVAKQLQAEKLKLRPVPTSALQEILNTLSLLTDDMVVIVYSAHNVLPEEDVEVSFELTVDRIIFKKGELIIRARMGAEVGAEELPTLISNVLTAVRAVTLRRGLLPDITTGEVGTISSGALRELAEELAAVSTPCVLEIHAGRDVKTTDRLDRFIFKVLPAEDVLETEAPSAEAPSIETVEKKEGSPERPPPS